MRPRDLTILLVALLLSINAQAQEHLRLHVTSGFPAPVSDYFESVMKELDVRLDDIRITFETLPAERSLDLVNRGINDAECCRIPVAVMPRYQNLVPLQQSFHTIQYVAFSRAGLEPIEAFDDLRPYSVGTVQGWRLAVREIERVQPREQYILNTPAQLMEMLHLGRIEVAVLGLLTGLDAARDAGISDLQVHKNPPLAALPLVLMLNKRHQELAQRLDSAILDMHKDGTIARLRKSLLNAK